MIKLTNNKSSVKKQLTLFGFFALTASMVLTVYEYPTFATSKLQLIFFLIVGGFLWFVPVALCAAEMATVDGWNENGGGVFSWVGHTLGERFGFANIFFQWFQITVGFVTMIYFILGALASVFNWPALDTNPTIKFFGVLVVFWILTFSQFGGTKNTAKIAKVGFIGGILFPSAILFVLAICYLVQGGPLQISFSARGLIPNFSKLNTLVVFVSFILAYMGVEASASHVNELKDPQRNYPLAILILVILAIILDTVGGITIAAVVPQAKLSLSAGVVQGFQFLILHFDSHMMILVRIIALLLAMGVAAEISAWVVGPSRGLFATAQQGILPKWFRKTNSHDVPTNLVLIQGLIVSIWDAVLTFGGNGNNVSFFAAISLTVVIYLSGYILFFLGYFVLVYKHRDLKRAYHVPGGTTGKSIIAGCGLILSIFALLISFVPPSSIAPSSDRAYETILIISYIIALILPFLIYAFRSNKHGSQEKVATATDHASHDKDHGNNHHPLTN